MSYRDQTVDFCNRLVHFDAQSRSMDTEMQRHKPLPHLHVVNCFHIVVMFSSQSAEISLGVPCRCVSAIWGDKVDSRFVVASCNVQAPNNLYVLRFLEVNEVALDAILPHASAVSRLVCSRNDPDLVMAVPEHSMVAQMYRLPTATGGDGGDTSDALGAPLELEAVSAFQAEDVVLDVAWRDVSEDSNAAVVMLDRSGRVSQWDVEVATQLANKDGHAAKTTIQQRVVWDPHSHGTAVAVTRGTAVQILDWRSDSSVPGGFVDSFTAHRNPVMDLDYNPNKPYVLTTAGQDGLLKFWDLRKAHHPLLTARGGHSHWVASVRYNPFHDQLVLSSGTDSVVNLWRVSSISSAPLLTLDDDASDSDASPNARVDRYEHGDSVYGATWSASDAWIYMTVAYDGKVTVSHVPSKEKYKILL